MLTSTLENILNRGLPRSPRARQLCAELAGKRIAIEVSGITRLLVESDGLALRVSRSSAKVSPDAGISIAPDAEISGGPMSLLALLRASAAAVIQRGDVRIRGDAELAQKFQELALLLRPDIEEELARVIGDIPAHQLGRFTRAALGWGQRATDTSLRNIAEYLAHERKHLVSRAEGEQFLRGVDRLRDDVDRMALRVTALTQQKKSGA